MKKYKIAYTQRFHKDYLNLPENIQKKTDEQIERLANGNFSYPSLRMKKIKGEENVWEASITMNYRMVFNLEKDLIMFFKIGSHDIL